MKSPLSKKNISIKLDYNQALTNIISQIEKSKIQAFSQVNTVLLNSYWEIGKELSINSAYGKSIVEKLSLDLKLRYPDYKGYSSTNLWNMKRFYETYHKIQPVVGEFLFQISLTNQKYFVLNFQIGKSSLQHYGKEYFPYAFTEQGVAIIYLLNDNLINLVEI